MSALPFPPRRPSTPSPVSRGIQCMLVLLGAAALGAGCIMAPPGEAPGDSEASSASDALIFRNGMTPNGLITNGLITNGLITNGLITNGLSTTGLLSESFTTWFNSNPPEHSDMVMKYVVACAYAEGTSLTYVTSSRTYTWQGRLGLAPGWASGLATTLTEQHVISACLAALVNKYGHNIEVSIRGKNAVGNAIAMLGGESTTFSVEEGAFFGNLFTDEGIFVCASTTNFNASESTARACGLSSQASGESRECPPLIHKGHCLSLCAYDKRTGTYSKCGNSGVLYAPLTTYLKRSDIYVCGDGICQVSESCDSSINGNGSTYDNCADCGPCVKPDGGTADAGSTSTTDGGTDGGSSGTTDGGRTGGGGKK